MAKILYVAIICASVVALSLDKLHLLNEKMQM